MNQTLSEFSSFDEVQDSLDHFYVTRIAIRTLIAQYLALKEQQINSENGLLCSEDNMGLVSLVTNPFTIAQEVCIIYYMLLYAVPFLC